VTRISTGGGGKSPIRGCAVLKGFDLHPVFDSGRGTERAWQGEGIGIHGDRADHANGGFTGVPPGLICHQRRVCHCGFGAGDVGWIDGNREINHLSARAEP